MLYDTDAKQLLSDKAVLAVILKSCVPEFRDVAHKDIADKCIEGTPDISSLPLHPPLVKISGLSTEDNVPTEGVIYYDIRFRATAPGSEKPIELIINVEAQNDFHPGYPIPSRAFYYCARMLSSQYNAEFTGNLYGDIKKVYSIWVCFNAPAYAQNTIVRYYTEREVIAGREYKEPESNYDLMNVIVACLGAPDSEATDDALDTLNAMFSRSITQEARFRWVEDTFGLATTRSLRERIGTMSNLGQGIWDKAHEEGRKEGREEGFFDLAKAFIDRGFSAEQVAEIAGIPIDKLLTP